MQFGVFRGTLFVAADVVRKQNFLKVEGHHQVIAYPTELYPAQAIKYEWRVSTSGDEVSLQTLVCLAA